MACLSGNHREMVTCAKTDTGLKRKENEDHFLVIDDHDERYDTGSLGMLFAVADGISGHKGGSKASRMACEGLLDYYTERSNSVNAKNFTESRLKALEDVFHRVHMKIYGYSLKVKEYEGMGTTLSALILLNDIALIAHVGDSRIYRLRNHCLEKLTHDHTMAQLSVEMGYIKQEDAENHPQRHILMDVVGQGLDEVRTRMEKVMKGDIYLLCTDGLHHMVPDDRIKEILEAFHPEDGACDRLVREAIERGGRDNITVIAVHV
ncbi:PP2C family protein-serine/threonine phosphatase [Thermodesulfobacteriota bacterium]